MSDSSGQDEDTEQSRDAPWSQWPTPAAEVSGRHCMGAGHLKRTEIFGWKMHTSLNPPLLHCKFILPCGRQAHAPDQPLRGTRVWRDHFQASQAAALHRHTGLHRRTPPHTQATQGLMGGWAAFPPPHPRSNLAPVSWAAGSQAWWAGPLTRLM